MNESQLEALAGIIGWTLGVLLGINGLVVGLMCSGNFRKYRRFISVNIRVWIYVGLLGVSSGAVFVFGRYPRAVWHPCVLIGVVLLVLGLMLRRAAERRIQAMEQEHSRPTGPRRH